MIEALNIMIYTPHINNNIDLRQSWHSIQRGNFSTKFIVKFCFLFALGAKNMILQ